MIRFAMLCVLATCSTATAEATAARIPIRVAHSPIPAHHTASNSYKAAVVQTVWTKGPGCCPTDFKTHCPGAEPVEGLTPCNGTAEQTGNLTKMSNVARLVSFIATAADNNADIVVFSEGALGIAGYSYKGSDGKMHGDGGGVASGDLAEYIGDPKKHPAGKHETNHRSHSNKFLFHALTVFCLSLSVHTTPHRPQVPSSHAPITTPMHRP